ncbi:hypothetical protein T4C_12693 [Trichinella pseudospiralis]|uniref:Peptidase A2 domain-containing protein n=1 Tax=Trichinella pseudospiralis TaxID=6337 RepID=A0A0V1IH66_TRIPS|nr:hypothetical protein T4C_12693 [Trichinella pseudospiralis]
MMTAAALDATSIFGPERFSDLVRLLRVTAWCRRFIDNASIPVGLRRVKMRLSIEELSDAERLLIRQSQIQAFGESDAARPHPMKSLKEISPFLDKFGILRAKAYGGAESGLTVTCLLDTGAECSFIRQGVALLCFGGAAHEHPRSQMVRLWLGRLDGNRSAELFPLEALTVPSPTFDDESSDEVHVVISIDYYHRFLGDAIRRGKPVNPRPVPKSVATFSATVEPQVEDLLRRFWEMEASGTSSNGDSNELDQEKRFRDGLLYDGTRYSSYLENSWAEEVKKEGRKGRMWITHHVVTQQGPEAIKHRIVFDSSVKFEGTSLNEQLYPGPKLQADLLGILLRFRRFKDRDVCRLLWRKDKLRNPLTTYRLTRVCFRLACSPYLDMQVANHHLSANHDRFGAIADDIKASMYVDDLVVSCDTVAEAKDFVCRSSELLASGGFHLVKWVSNVPQVLVDRPTEETLENKPSRLCKTLGISWNPQEEELTFRPSELVAS